MIFNWSVVKVDVKSQGPGISQVTLAWWLVRSLVKLRAAAIVVVVVAAVPPFASYVPGGRRDGGDCHIHPSIAS